MMHMGEHVVAAGGLGISGITFEPPGFYEQQRPRIHFKMPRVVPNQKEKFETDDLFRRLSRENDVVYTGCRDRPKEEQRTKFMNGCQEGFTEIAFKTTGTNLQLVFAARPSGFAGEPRECDYDKEPGKVHIRSRLIMNGVCVMWRGWIDLDNLEGTGCLELDEERAAQEDALLREQIESHHQRMRELEGKQRAYRAGGGPASYLNHHPDVHAHQVRMGMQQQSQQQQQHQHQQQQAASRCATDHGQRPHGIQSNLQARKKNDLSYGHHN